MRVLGLGVRGQGPSLGVWGGGPRLRRAGWGS